MRLEKYDMTSQNVSLVQNSFLKKEEILFCVFYVRIRICLGLKCLDPNHVCSGFSDIKVLAHVLNVREQLILSRVASSASIQLILKK